MVQTVQKQRVFAFDELRGVMILSMLVYNICYDLAELVRLRGMSWFYSEAAGWWQLSICGAFILISGACCAYSRNNLKRGFKLLGLGMLFTLVTVLVLPQQRILFGLLHFLGTAVLLSIPLKPLLERIPPWAGLAGGLLLFWLTYSLPSGRIGLSRTLSLELPPVLYSTSFLFPLGFPDSNFFSSDYFPLLPYLFLFLAGMFLARLPLPQAFYQQHSRSLSLLGKNSLWVYLLHQPVIYAVLWLIFRF